MALLKYTIGFMVSSVFVSHSYAESINQNLTIKGNLIIAPPAECILNSGSQQTVNFGDVLLPRLDGVNYKQVVPLRLSCTNLPSNTLKMSIIGDPTTFNSNGGLKTSNNKLGIVFYVNNEKKTINTPISFSYTNVPKLEAAPLRNVGATYSSTDGGKFSATATLKVDYQ